MKILFKVIVMALFLVCIQEISLAQPIDDKSLVIQKCIDLTELQQYYPVDEAGSPSQIYVMEYPVAFSPELNVSKSGKQVLFMSREDVIANKVKAYFIFRSLDISGNLAKANINYFYDFDYTTQQSKIVMVNVEMNKVGSAWDVTTINLKGDTK